MVHLLHRTAQGIEMSVQATRLFSYHLIVQRIVQWDIMKILLLDF